MRRHVPSERVYAHCMRTQGACRCELYSLLSKSEFEEGSRALWLCPALFLVASPRDPGTLSLVCVLWCEYNNSLMNECVQICTHETAPGCGHDARPTSHREPRRFVFFRFWFALSSPLQSFCK